LLDIDEAKKYLSISKNSLYGYGYTSRNIIPYHKVQGRKIYFSVEDLNNFVLNKNNRYKSNEEIETEAVTKIVTEKMTF
jgi:hypothetical protein